MLNRDADISAGTGAALARAYWPAMLVALAFLWLFHGTIVQMADRWASDETFSHGFVVAPAALAIAWYRRDTWLGTPVRPAMAAGLSAIVAGLLVMVLAAWADVMFMPYVAMLIVVGGMILYFGGWEWFRKLSFPYAFLYFMVPWPDFLVEFISFPMQINTSVYASTLGHLIGIPVVRDGVNLAIPPVHANFEVAVACSGMRSLVALMCLSAGFAYFTPASMWKRWSLFVIGLPMALVANILRVFAILCVAYWISPQLAGKAFHDWSSPVLFLFSTMGLMAIRNVMLRAPQTAPVAGPSTDASGRLEPSAEDDDAF